MLTAIKGTFQNGYIILEEPAPTTKTVPVLVTFLQYEDQNINITQKKIIGSLEGKISIPDDFNEPLDDLKEYMY